jgi:hypothetical protein
MRPTGNCSPAGCRRRRRGGGRVSRSGGPGGTPGRGAAVAAARGWRRHRQGAARASRPRAPSPRPPWFPRTGLGAAGHGLLARLSFSPAGHGCCLVCFEVSGGGEAGGRLVLTRLFGLSIAGRGPWEAPSCGGASRLTSSQARSWREAGRPPASKPRASASPGTTRPPTVPLFRNPLAKHGSQGRREGPREEGAGQEGRGRKEEEEGLQGRDVQDLHLQCVAGARGGRGGAGRGGRAFSTARRCCRCSWWPCGAAGEQLAPCGGLRQAEAAGAPVPAAARLAVASRRPG